MLNTFLNSLLPKYFEIVENGILHSHYMETTFATYSRLVKAIIEQGAIEIKNVVYFTGMCMPPFKWLNYEIDPLEVETLKNVNKMAANHIWTDYLIFMNQLKERKMPIHRCIFQAENGFNHRDLFKDILEEKYVTSQRSAKVIFDRENDLYPLNKKAILEIIGGNIENEIYRCYKYANSAYLIVDSTDGLIIDNTIYDIQSLATYFGRFQQNGHLHLWTYKSGETLNGPLPEDFFLIGVSNGGVHDADWKAALCADVSRDLSFVKLWFIAPGLVGKKPSGNDVKLEKYFDFDTLVNFIKGHVTSQFPK